MLYNKSKDILLINPPDIFSPLFPSGLGQIAGSLLSEGFDLEIMDFVKKHSMGKMLQNEVIDRLKQAGFKIVGLTGMVHNYHWLRELSFKIKSLHSNIYIIAGGHWAYHEPELILKTTGVDVVVNGEGDYVIRDICRAILDTGGFGGIKGITYKDNGEFFSNDLPEPINNLDQLPIPPYKYFDMENYIFREECFSEDYHKDSNLAISMQTGRGCVGRCMFCTGEKQIFRKYSPLYVINHIKYLKDSFGVNLIRFKEALTLGNNRWLEEFCNSLINEKINIQYECISRVDTINEDIVKLLRASGCYQIQFGIESGDDYILSEIAQKKITSEKARYAISLCRKNNIVPRGGFIIGLPGETIRSLNKTLRFIWDTKIEETGVTFPTPFPGTRLFKLALKRFQITKEEVFIDSSNMTYDEELQDRLIDKYNFTSINPAVFKIYRFLYNEFFLLNRLYRKRKYYSYIRELSLFFVLRLVKRLFKIFFVDNINIKKTCQIIGN